MRGGKLNLEPASRSCGKLIKTCCKNQKKKYQYNKYQNELRYARYTMRELHIERSRALSLLDNCHVIISNKRQISWQTFPYAIEEEYRGVSRGGVG